MPKCLATAWRVISNPAHISFSVCPFRARKRSSKRRRLFSATARKPASMLMRIICNQMVAYARAEERDGKLFFKKRLFRAGIENHVTAATLLDQGIAGHGKRHLILGCGRFLSSIRTGGGFHQPI